MVRLWTTSHLTILTTAARWQQQRRARTSDRIRRSILTSRHTASEENYTE